MTRHINKKPLHKNQSCICATSYVEFQSSVWCAKHSLWLFIWSCNQSRALIFKFQHCSHSFRKMAFFTVVNMMCFFQLDSTPNLDSKITNSNRYTSCIQSTSLNCLYMSALVYGKIFFQNQYDFPAKWVTHVIKTINRKHYWK